MIQGSRVACISEGLFCCGRNTRGWEEWWMIGNAVDLNGREGVGRLIV